MHIHRHAVTVRRVGVKLDHVKVGKRTWGCLVAYFVIVCSQCCTLVDINGSFHETYSLIFEEIDV